MKKNKKATLNDLLSEAHKSGVKVSVGLDPKIQMPARFTSDPKSVAMLVAESERVTDIGNRWMEADKPNSFAGQMALQQGWAHALSAAWLRCKLKGELLPESSRLEILESQFNTAMQTLEQIAGMNRRGGGSLPIAHANATVTFIKECQKEAAKHK